MLKSLSINNKEKNISIYDNPENWFTYRIDNQDGLFRVCPWILGVGGFEACGVWGPNLHDNTCGKKKSFILLLLLF